MKQRLEWWKVLAILLLYYTVVAGFLLPVPRLPILNESIRLFYFHFPLWCTMLLLFVISLWSSIGFLRSNRIELDDRAALSATVGILFGLLGLATGMLWGKATWGTFWTSDPKLNNTAISLLIYAAYFVLRSSLQDETQRGRLSAVYNIFAFSVMIPLIFILPRMTDSLHPGNGGNPGFSIFDTSHNMKFVIYTAIIAFCLTGWWITTLLIKVKAHERRVEEV
ncbi:cytochrome c biogenesis protein CcsA [Chryseolinea sp. T2]|uniref:cytochrome c biogenesis protein CcsA n=1 Tax=Chryseolinea sp. T2 TaxID=3129255 RepID=UPI003076EAA0